MRDRLIVGGGAEGAAKRGAVEKHLQRGDHRDRDGELDERQQADPDAGADLVSHCLDGAGLQFAAIGGEQFQQAVLDDDRQAEGHQKRWQQVVAERAVEQEALQGITDDRHRRHDQQQRSQRIETEGLRHHQRDVGGEHDQIAMGDVDQPHDAEDQRQAGGEHGVEPADQHALQDDVEPFGHRYTPK